MPKTHIIARSACEHNIEPIQEKIRTMPYTSQLRSFTVRASLALLLALLLHPPAQITPVQAQMATPPGWTALTLPAGVTAPAIISLTLAPDDAAHAFLVSASGVYTTTNAGTSWTQLTALVTPTNAFVIAPDDSARIYAWGSALSRSDDGGARWT